jgi:hypothetical protein
MIEDITVQLPYGLGSLCSCKIHEERMTILNAAVDETLDSKSNRIQSERRRKLVVSHARYLMKISEKKQMITVKKEKGCRKIRLLRKLLKK